MPGTGEALTREDQEGDGQLLGPLTGSEGPVSVGLPSAASAHVDLHTQDSVVSKRQPQ